jgi:hypothetical protein
LFTYPSRGDIESLVALAVQVSVLGAGERV